ncbi:HU family DNA-binding protein [Streptomyces parvulus]|uniref:HU family DNA-binding protein n=1 Tax=Streptomyces parvulus TaxID=146923 RepID=UPI001CF9EC99|nr:HU family DNA-binding protein [Streptomyces parvulus]
MDKARLIEATAHRAAPEGGRSLTVEDVERVCDALFGTVERAGVIAEALEQDEKVILGSFGGFRRNDRDAAFDPGTALTEYLRGETR